MVKEQFLRTSLLLGEEGIKRLQQASVMVVGVGAVGGYVVEALARAGVGHLILVDFDAFDESNINRQILALHSTVGRKKVVVAKERILDINPDCVVETKEMFVNAETLPELLKNKVDFVVDAIDSLNPKCCLMEALWQQKIPFISSMGAALKTDTSCIKFGHLSQTKNCSLSKFVRRRLKKRKVEISEIDCVYSDEQINLPQNALLETNDEGEDMASSGRKRHILGSLPTITAIFGLTIANQVIKKISQKNKQEK